MKVAVAYVFPLVQSGTYYRLAQRFADTWRKFPPGSTPAELHVIMNGAVATPREKDLFAGLATRVHHRDNFGWDIGAFQFAADAIPCDLLVCLGAPVHFYRPGWLDRMVEVFLNEGPNLYGCWGYHFPGLHIRTTAFWLPPPLLYSYPAVVGSARASRYDFEHGPNSITRHVLQYGFEAVVASWTQTWSHARWPEARFGIGDCLCLDQHTHQ